MFLIISFLHPNGVFFPHVTASEMDSSTSKPLTSPFSYSSPTVWENHASQESPETGSTFHPNSPSSEATTYRSPSNSGTTSTTQPTSSQPEPELGWVSGSGCEEVGWVVEVVPEFEGLR